MKYLKTYKLFESRFIEFQEMISTINDICQEFIDHNCFCGIFPKDDIKLNIVSLKSRGHLGSISQPFYLEIDIDRRIIEQDEKRSGFGPFPDWFIDTCRRIEDYMSSNEFVTKPSVRYGTDWENFETIDELSEVIGLIYKVKLEFFPTKKSLDESINHDQIMELKYGRDTLDECDSMISDIKDMLLELKDIGLFVTVGYTPMTLTSRDDTPKIVAEVQGDSLKCSYIEDDIDAAFERIKKYTSSKGYVNGFGTWERDVEGGLVMCFGKKMSVYQILIQK